MQNPYKNLILWGRKGPGGRIIAGSVQYRPRKSGKPKDGEWMQMSDGGCCAPDQSFIIFQNTSNTTISAISTADGAIDWTGTVAATTGIITFEIPNSYNETFTITVGATGKTLTNTTPVGSGTISAATAPTTTTFSFTTTATPGSQYLAKLS